MRLVYFGTGTFAVPALERLAAGVVLVVTQPDRPSGRGHRLGPTPVKEAALRLGLPVEAPEKARDAEFVARVRELDADALVVASYGQILSVKLLESARRGGINLHGSLLPAWRGAAPIQRAILAGDRETGVTLMQMDRGMDTGDEIARAATPIGPDETYGELQDRLAGLAADLAEEWMPRIAAGAYRRVPQDHDRATLAPKVEKEEAELRFERSAEEEYRRFRAFSPTPGAWGQTGLGRIRLGEVRRAEGQGAPGTVLSVRPLVVAFAEGALEWRELQPEGKKRVSGVDWANGARLRPGVGLMP